MQKKKGLEEERKGRERGKEGWAGRGGRERGEGGGPLDNIRCASPSAGVTAGYTPIIKNMLGVKRPGKRGRPGGDKGQSVIGH